MTGAGRLGRGLVLPALLLLVWEVVARLALVSSFLLPSPAAIVRALGTMARDGTLLLHLAASVGRVAAGFAVGALLGTGLGLLVGLSVRAEAILDPLLQGLRSVPSLAWVPLLLLWLGIGEAPKVTLIAVGSFFPVYLGTISGARGVDPRLLEVGRVKGLAPAALIRRILLPAATPALVTGLRTGLAVAWLYVVAAELMAANAGLGFLLTDGRELSRADLIFAAILLLAVCGKTSDGLWKRLERRLLAWRQPAIPLRGPARGLVAPP